ncbi:hypothetical protein D8674_026522 [Pyrus ussuriensis x Pyrus communis]|uniref:Uncharacterized protein n=1 Tax=Pyrus ussuriensis x Pyrus communis TaxID=2448454 RepID=A0A5N5I859_9ROSA|nr:hypothetical protein D8674_026522 [Pyrus ussuriensis x Pyrus communis]
MSPPEIGEHAAMRLPKDSRPHAGTPKKIKMGKIVRLYFGSHLIDGCGIEKEQMKGCTGMTRKVLVGTIEALAAAVGNRDSKGGVEVGAEAVEGDRLENGQKGPQRSWCLLS